MHDWLRRGNDASTRKSRPVKSSAPIEFGKQGERARVVPQAQDQLTNILLRASDGFHSEPFGELVHRVSGKNVAEFAAEQDAARPPSKS